MHSLHLGHQEDAATGVAAAALSLALKQDIVVAQGFFLNRPSKLIISYENAENIWVGGKVQEQKDVGWAKHSVPTK